MSSTLSTAAIAPIEGYRLWARTYDREPNPMLSVEQRFLEALLPDVKNLDVVDLGCGTGRWLATLKDSSPRSLLGVDSSPEMLGIAKSKLGSAATFVNGDCQDIVLPDRSADLILCSFLLSYIEEADSFLRKAKAMLRPGGSLFLTDLHPETVTRLNWRRGVQWEGQFREIRTFRRGLQEVAQLCENAGLNVAVCLQPRFGEPEQLVFQAAGKQGYFEQVKEYPAIYILQLRAQQIPSQSTTGNIATPDRIDGIRGAKLAIGPSCATVGEVQFANSRISAIRDCKEVPSFKPCSQTDVDLNGFLVFPGLVNPHDHLEFGLFPRLGRGTYKNFLEWVDDIHRPDRSPVFEHRQVPREIRLWWGGIRNLLSGVTTVCHHNPYDAAVFEDDFVIRVVREYGWAHSLPMDADVANKKANTPSGRPFLIHLGEGIDERSAAEIFELHRAGALDEDTILIHGIALDREGRELVRSAGAGLIWCPSSNIFLFGETLSFGEIQEFARVALGSDSPLTAEGDLLDELRFAHEFIGAPAEKLHSYVTRNAAQLLRLRNGEGTLGIGSWADLIAVRDMGANPADTLAALSHAQVELVLLGGRVQLASAEMMKRLPPGTTAGLNPLRVEGSVRWIRAPLEKLFAETAAHLGKEFRLGGKRVSLGF